MRKKHVKLGVGEPAFSLIELLAAVAIVAGLIVYLYPTPEEMGDAAEDSAKSTGELIKSSWELD